MKGFILIAALLVSAHAMAADPAAAAGYNCLGKDSISDQVVAFDVVFADSAPGHGYTNQSITINKIGAGTLDVPIIYQMYGANRKNHCKANEVGEIYVANDDAVDMSSSEKPTVGEQIISIKVACGEQNLNVTGVCFFGF